MQASPISARVNHLPVVIGSGKMGYVYEMNADTGKLIWKTPVGEHNGHDDSSLWHSNTSSRSRRRTRSFPDQSAGS